MYQQGSTTVYAAGAAVPGHATTAIITSPRSTLNVNGTRGLGIAQIVIGLVTICLGIGVLANIGYSYWVSGIGGGIWAGVWIIITGILGVATASNPSNSCLVGTTLAFNIISTVIAFIDGIFFMIGLIYSSSCYYSYNYNYNRDGYRYYRTYYQYYNCEFSGSLGQALFGVLMALMIVEFFVALIAAVYCCSGCCGSTSQGVIVQQQPHYQVTATSTGNYPQMQYNYPQGMPYQMSGPPQPGMYNQAPVYTGQAEMGTTNISYPVDHPTSEKAHLLNNQPTAPATTSPPFYNMPPNPPPYSQ